MRHSRPLLYVHAINFPAEIPAGIFVDIAPTENCCHSRPSRKAPDESCFHPEFFGSPATSGAIANRLGEGVCSKRNRGSALPISRLPVAGAVVLLEALLSNPVKRQRGDRAVEARCGHASRAHGTAPADEIVTLNPDHALHHRPFVMADWCFLDLVTAEKARIAGPENHYVRVFRVELPPHSQASVYQNTHDLVWVALSDSTLSIAQGEGERKELGLISLLSSRHEPTNRFCKMRSQSMADKRNYTINIAPCPVCTGKCGGIMPADTTAH
jgi:hypothetical protein